MRSPLGSCSVECQEGECAFASIVMIVVFWIVRRFRVLVIFVLTSAVSSCESLGGKYKFASLICLFGLVLMLKV